VQKMALFDGISGQIGRLLASWDCLDFSEGVFYAQFACS
jgi:hypothetical protein